MLEGQVPLRVEGVATNLAVVELRLPDPDEVAVSARQRLWIERDLGGLRRTGAEQREPERTAFRLARFLVGRVADPHTDWLGRVRCLEVPALVAHVEQGACQHFSSRARRRVSARQAHARPSPPTGMWC